MTWTKKSTTTMETSEMRLGKLQLVVDEQSPMRIKPDSLIFLVKRKLQEHCVLLNRQQRDTCSIQRLVSDLCCESWTKFSAQTSCGKQDSGYTAEIPDRPHVHSNSGREQNSAMYHIRGNAQWSGDQLHVRSERWLRGSDEGNPATF